MIGAAIVVLIVGITIGWTAKTTVLRNKVRLEYMRGTWVIWFGNRIWRSHHDRAVANATKDKLLATIRGRRFSS